MNGNGYDSFHKVLPGAFNREQRTRLEAVTAASKLKVQGSTAEWLDIAAYIETGENPKRSGTTFNIPGVYGTSGNS